MLDNENNSKELLVLEGVNKNDLLLQEYGLEILNSKKRGREHSESQEMETPKKLKNSSIIREPKLNPRMQKFCLTETWKEDNVENLHGLNNFRVITSRAQRTAGRRRAKSGILIAANNSIYKQEIILNKEEFIFVTSRITRLGPGEDRSIN